MNKEFYILRYERTEYAKRIRKDYESKRIKERRCNMRKWGIRHDGLCNTLSTVQKDNYLLEVTYKDDRDMNKDIVPVLVGGVGEINFGKQYRQGIGDSKMNNLRIRKLTPKECFRLMGFDDEDFYKAEAVNSNAQLYTGWQ